MDTKPLRNRRQLRLRDFDYSSPGFYFVTVCAENRACVFGEIFGGKVVLGNAGQLVAESWQRLPLRFPAITMDGFVVMPNHLHGIVQILQPSERWAQQAAPLRTAPALGQVMRAFKSTSAIAIKKLLGRPGRRVWQRAYYEHVIRNEDDLKNVREYIQQNPLRWALDRDNPAATLIGHSKTPWLA